MAHKSFTLPYCDYPCQAQRANLFEDYKQYTSNDGIPTPVDLSNDAKKCLRISWHVFAGLAFKASSGRRSPLSLILVPPLNIAVGLPAFFQVSESKKSTRSQFVRRIIFT